SGFKRFFQELADHLVADSGNSDFLSFPQTVTNHSSSGVRLARTRRTLNREYMIHSLTAKQEISRGPVLSFSIDIVVHDPLAQPEQRFGQRPSHDDGMREDGGRMNIGHGTSLFDINCASRNIYCFDISTPLLRGLEFIASPT